MAIRHRDPIDRNPNPQTRTCPSCKGQGETAADLHRQPSHTDHSNPFWEPWEPDFRTCDTCAGTGVVTA